MNKKTFFASMALLIFAVGTGSIALAQHGPGSGIKDDRMDSQTRTTRSSEAVQKLNPYNNQNQVQPRSEETRMHKTTEDSNYYERSGQSGQDNRMYRAPNSPNNR